MVNEIVHAYRTAYDAEMQASLGRTEAAFFGLSRPTKLALRKDFDRAKAAAIARLDRNVFLQPNANDKLNQFKDNTLGDKIPYRAASCVTHERAAHGASSARADIGRMSAFHYLTAKKKVDLLKVCVEEDGAAAIRSNGFGVQRRPRDSFQFGPSAPSPHILLSESLDHLRYRHLSLDNHISKMRFQNKQEVFDEIFRKARKLGVILSGVQQYKGFVIAELAESKLQYPFMETATQKEYHLYAGLKMSQLHCQVDDHEGPAPTNEDFWNAAYEYDPQANSTPANRDLIRILNSRLLGPVTIGKLWGKTTLRLSPTLGSLPAQELDFEPAHKITFAHGVAIVYPDGYPTKDMLRLQPLPPPLASPSSPLQKLPVIKPSEDGALRRLTSLGWVLMKSHGRWRKTGHVLVMDMDDREVRHRQPWLVLAYQWPTDFGEETQEGSSIVTADESVARNNELQPGVFPGDNNRTPICSIRPLQTGHPTIPVLKQLGPNFSFAPRRVGGPRPVQIKSLGPDIPRVMDWYWDDTRKLEICYNQNGEEVMWYAPLKREYGYPGFSRTSIVGEQAMFGEVIADGRARGPSRETSRAGF
ncbi:MAG: hypothetical protein Q9207_000888 [Kuettlingeria erythrocarpa]